MKTYTFVYALFAAALCHAATDPFLGKWTLDTAKTKYPKTVPKPKSMSIVMEPAGDDGTSVHYRSEIRFPNGKFASGKLSDGTVATTEYTNNYSGTPVAVGANGGVGTPVALKKIDERTVVATYVRGNTVLATSKRVVSKDGRTMTITTVSKDKDGKSVTTVGVYDRVDP